MKWLTTDYAVPQIAFMRYLFGLALAVVLASRMGGLGTLATRRPLGHALRSVFNLATMIAFYYALKLMPLADTMAITFATPPFMVALSVLLLKEKVGIRRWSAVVVGFLGVILILQLSGSGMAAGALLALVSAFLYALTLITSRQLSTTEPSHTILFYYSVGVLLVTGMVGLLGETMLPAWHWAPLETADLWIFVLVGVSAASASSSSIRPSATARSPCWRRSSTRVCSGGSSTAWWGEWPSWLTLFGAAVVAGSSLYIAHREARRSRAKDLGEAWLWRRPAPIDEA